MVIIMPADPAINAVALLRSSVMRPTVRTLRRTVNANSPHAPRYRTKSHPMSRNAPPPSPKPARGTARPASNWPAAKKKVAVSPVTKKIDLFLSDVEDFFEMMSTALIRHNDASNRVAPVQEFFAHVAEMRQLVSSMAASQKIRDVFDLGQGHFARAIDQRLAALPATRNLSATRRSALAHASAGSLFSLLNWWLNHGGSATAAQMDALFHKTLWSGISPS